MNNIHFLNLLPLIFLFILLSIIRHMYFMCVYLQPETYTHLTKVSREAVLKLVLCIFFSYSIDTLTCYPLKNKECFILLHSRIGSYIVTVKTLFLKMSTMMVKSGIFFLIALKKICFNKNILIHGYLLCCPSQY